jgi:hypothetical protein
MSKFWGLGELKTPCDLVQKLEHDFRRLSEMPQDQYIAFDFFVTAEHIIDWIHSKDREKREKLRGLPLLAVTSHIANGAKHFEVTAKHHQSVEDVEKSRYVKTGYVKEDYSDDSLFIHLSPMYQEYFGTSCIEVVTLAEKVLQYWRDKTPKA